MFCGPVSTPIEFTLIDRARILHWLWTMKATCMRSLDASRSGLLAKEYIFTGDFRSREGPVKFEQISCQQLHRSITGLCDDDGLAVGMKGEGAPCVGGAAAACCATGLAVQLLHEALGRPEAGAHPPRPQLPLIGAPLGQVPAWPAFL